MEIAVYQTDSCLYPNLHHHLVGFARLLLFPACCPRGHACKWDLRGPLKGRGLTGDFWRWSLERLWSCKWGLERGLEGKVCLTGGLEGWKGGVGSRQGLGGVCQGVWRGKVEGRLEAGFGRGGGLVGVGSGGWRGSGKGGWEGVSERRVWRVARSELSALGISNSRRGGGHRELGRSPGHQTRAGGGGIRLELQVGRHQTQHHHQEQEHRHSIQLDVRSQYSLEGEEILWREALHMQEGPKQTSRPAKGCGKLLDVHDWRSRARGRGFRKLSLRSAQSKRFVSEVGMQIQKRL